MVQELLNLLNMDLILCWSLEIKQFEIELPLPFIGVEKKSKKRKTEKVLLKN